MLVFCIDVISEVELEKAETTSTSRSSRTTRSESFALLRSSDSFLNAFSRILEVELAIAEMACVSRNVRRTLHVPSGVPVQRSISERSSQWFIDFLFITRDSRKSNKLCGRKTTKRKRLALRVFF